MRKTWIDLVRPHIGPYAALPRGKRELYAQELANRLNLELNTVQRQLLAAQYLSDRNLNHVRAPLMAVEAVARAGRYNRRVELQLLQELQRGERTIAYYREQAEQAASRRLDTTLGHATHKEIGLEEAVDHLRTMSDQTSASFRSRLTLHEIFCGHTAGLEFVLTNVQGDRFSLFNFPYSPYGNITEDRSIFIGRALALSLVKYEYTIVLCPFEFDVVEDITKTINGRNRPFLYRLFGQLPKDCSYALGFTIDQ